MELVEQHIVEAWKSKRVFKAAAVRTIFTPGEWNK
jgi:hypothetical protein